MIEKADQLYKELMEMMSLCDDPKLFRKQHLECRYNKAVNCWNHLKNLLNGYRFDTTEKEIYFFKRIKPLFIAEIEYYNLQGHAEMVKPSQTPA